MTIHTAYTFRHYRSLEPGNALAPQVAVWASSIGELDGTIRRGSKEDLELINSQEWALNFLTDGGEQQIIECFFRNNHTPTFYLALYSATSPGETWALNDGGLTEPSGNGYARQSVARDTTGSGWGAAALDSGDYQTVSPTKTFNATGGAWSTSVNHLALVSPSSGTSGTLYAITALSGTRTLSDGDSLQTTLTIKLS
jgi:hypothetical protein